MAVTIIVVGFRDSDHLSTRWGSSHADVRTVKERFVSIICTLKEVFKDQTIGAEAQGLLTTVSSFSFLFFYISVLDSVLRVSHVLSQYLQGTNVTLQSAGRSARSVVSTLKKYRTDECFRKDFGDLWRKKVTGCNWHDQGFLKFEDLQSALTTGLACTFSTSTRVRKICTEQSILKY